MRALVALMGLACLLGAAKDQVTPWPGISPSFDRCEGRSTFEECALSDDFTRRCQWQQQCIFTNYRACWTASDASSCSAMDGCSWQSYQERWSPPPSSKPYSSPSVPPPNASPYTPPNTTKAPWWEEEDHYSHGPIDLITPPVAANLHLLDSGASPAVCGGLAASILPPSIYGTVGISNLKLASVTISIDPSRLTAVEEKKSNVGAIVGGVVGGVWAVNVGGCVLLAGVAFLIYRIRKRRAQADAYSSVPDNQNALVTEPNTSMTPATATSILASGQGGSDWRVEQH